MSWKALTEDERKFAMQVVQYIRVAKNAGYPYVDIDWLPSEADLDKSALFERIRSGKEPLPYPPPVGLACPWYSIVEDDIPQRVGKVNDKFGPFFAYKEFSNPILSSFGNDAVQIVGSMYEIVSKFRNAYDEYVYIVKDIHHSPHTPYRFKLYHDDEWWYMKRAKEYEDV